MDEWKGFQEEQRVPPFPSCVAIYRPLSIRRRGEFASQRGTRTNLVLPQGYSRLWTSSLPFS